MSSSRIRTTPLVAACLMVALQAVTVSAADVEAAVAPDKSRFEIALSALGWGSPSLLAAASSTAPEDEVTTAQAYSASVARPPLPACEYKDVRTRYYRVGDWRKTLLDTNLRIKRDYAPNELVSVARANLKGVGSVRKLVIADLKAMANAARRAGKPLAVRSAYRSYDTQVATFNSWVRRAGYQQALKFSARPGHSEHQLGTTLDFTAAPGQPLSSTFGTSKQGRWMAANAWKYGFINPYPKGKTKVSCYGYEPWHWRYVGRELAAQIYESGQVPRRYYWQNFETAP